MRLIQLSALGSCGADLACCALAGGGLVGAFVTALEAVDCGFGGGRAGFFVAGGGRDGVADLAGRDAVRACGFRAGGAGFFAGVFWLYVRRCC